MNLENGGIQILIDKELDSNWEKLCKIGGISSGIMVICSFVTILIVILFGAEPGTVSEYFSILHDNRLIGILRLDFASVINVVQYYPLFLGLYFALKHENKAYMTLALAFAFVGTTIWFANHSSLSMIRLSDLYAVATTDVEKSQLLAAGEAVLASDMYHSTGSAVGGVLLQLAAVIVSVVMLKSKNFGKLVAYVGIIGNGSDLVRIVMNLLIPGNFGDYLMIIAGPLFIVWFSMLAWKLYKIGNKRINSISN